MSIAISSLNWQLPSLLISQSGPHAPTQAAKSVGDLSILVATSDRSHPYGTGSNSVAEVEFVAIDTACTIGK
jgi:hypothetical protein